MKFLSISLLSIILFTACRPSEVHKAPDETGPITDSVVKKEGDKEHHPPMKVLWVHKSLAAQLASDLDSLILFYVYSNEFQPSVDMDMKTFGDPEVASYINNHFVSIRAEYREMGGLFAPGTTMILAPNGDILLTVIGYVESKAMLDVLSQTEALDLMLNQQQNDTNGTPQTKVKPAPMPQPKKKEEREGRGFFQGRPGLDI